MALTSITSVRSSRQSVQLAVASRHTLAARYVHHNLPLIATNEYFGSSRRYSGHYFTGHIQILGQGIEFTIEYTTLPLLAN